MSIKCYIGSGKLIGYVLFLWKKKQFTTAVVGRDNIAINKVSENLTNYFI